MEMNMDHHTPRSEHSGGWKGHFAAATGFLVPSAAVLSYFLVQGNLQWPLKNVKALKTAAMFVFVFTAACSYFEWNKSKMHVALYTSHCTFAIVLWLEACGKLPWDTARGYLGLVNVLNAILWNGHAEMKTGVVDICIHNLLALVILAHGFVFFFSVLHPNNLPTGLACISMYFLEVIWLFTLGLYEGNHRLGWIDFSLHDAYAIFAIQATIVAFSSACLMVYFSPQRERNGRRHHHHKETEAFLDEEMEDDDKDYR